jgi:hypothetical protein
MFIPFLAASAVGIALIKLGAMSVQISVLTLAVKAALAVIALLVALIGLLLWQGRFKNS